MIDPKDAAQTRLKAIDIKPGDHFRHYKGGEYEIVTLALKEDTLEPLIIYRNLKTQTIWARAYEDWNQTVEINSQSLPRFQEIRTFS